jgi:4-hydroxy-3-methylbut-2-enyl diphosphate reductase
MKVNLAKSAGFCFGVKRAINIALKSGKANKNIFMLGDIVHNEDVVRKVRKYGIKKIKRLGNGTGKILLIRAHGTSREVIKKAKKLGYKITDATCPMVKEIHRIAIDMEKKGFRIIVIGDKKHDEVLGIIGQLRNKAILIHDIAELNLKKIKGIKKACVVAQSTQDLDKVINISTVLKKSIKNLKFFNTVCGPTRMKQKEIRIIPRDNDAVLVIGSKNSANTRRLYEIAKSLNPNTYWVNTKKDINSEWFRGISRVGITAGASTPEETIKEAINYISSL